MFQDLPREYDVIVVGTGLVESILAAACSRIGKSVLHIDTNEYYGSEWSSFPLNGLIEWTEMSKNAIEKVNIAAQDKNEQILQTNDPSKIFRNVQFKWNIEETNTENESEKATVEKLKKLSRRFNIDLTPKLYYSSGGVIDLLVQSNIGKYCEFKLVSRLLFERNGQLELVPSSRSDIFNSNDISLIDKRFLMKTISTIASMSIDNLQDPNMPFIDYLKQQKLNDNLCHLIINSIALVDYNATTREGVQKAKRYFESIGRYGNSPFLCQLYGCGELSQCFCRLSAVFGGFYYLRFPLAALTIDPSTNQCRGIVATTGERFTAKDAVICNTALVDSSEGTNEKVIHRIVLLTDKSIKTSEKEEITYVRLSGPNQPGIHVIEVGYGVGCTPEGFFLVYIFQEKSDDSKSDNNDWMIERLLQLTGENFTRANILGQLSFDQIDTISTSVPSTINKLFYTHGPDGSIDHDSAVNLARDIFQKIYSNGEQFLERAPDPEDIIIEGQSNTTEETSNANTDNEKDPIS